MKNMSNHSHFVPSNTECFTYIPAFKVYSTLHEVLVLIVILSISEVKLKG